MPTNFDILGIGVAAVDDILFVENYPVADAKARVLRAERHAGGLTTTALVAASRLGASCKYAGVLGDDELSNFTREKLHEEGIDTSPSPRQADARPVHATIIVDTSKSTRNIFFEISGSGGAHESLPAREEIEAAKVLFLDHFGMDGNLRAAKLAREAGVAVVADFEDDSAPELAELLTFVNHLILSSDFARRISGESSPIEAARKLWRGKGNVVAMTDGARGAFIVGEDGLEYSQPALKIETVDTTGCGDVFHGAYAAALAKGEDLASRFLLASIVAGLKAQQAGGQSGIPRREEVDHYLKENPHIKKQLELRPHL